MITFKKNLHVWITAAAMTAFLTGWGFLAHAPKPALIQTAASTTSQTITSSSPLQILQNMLHIRTGRNRNRSSSFTPTLRTGGS